ncbi:MAG: type II toxin-antitoxin system YafQ family toxin [Oscillospiraceae bacterium]|nr:type II toxin-antitoxin system YafQ family toxin [Oscillospiraceae bacterium]
MLKIEFQGQFKKDYKLAIKRGCNMQLFQEVVTLLAEEKTLPAKYKDHALLDSKEYKGMRECHIQPDWLLIYKIYKDTLILQLIRTGTHSDLF